MIGISTPWYIIPCSYGTAINVIPENVWFIVGKQNCATESVLHKDAYGFTGGDLKEE